jgi:hypothetical protein
MRVTHQSPGVMHCAIPLGDTHLVGPCKLSHVFSVVRAILQVARYGQYRGYNSLGVMCQNLENPHLRKALGMPQGATGVLINNVQQTSTAAKVCAGSGVLLAVRVALSTWQPFLIVDLLMCASPCTAHQAG